MQPTIVMQPGAALWSQVAERTSSAPDKCIDPLRHTFSEADRRKMDQDLSLLHQLSLAMSRAHQSLLVVDFGYAADALCAGAFRRYHHDMDIRLIVPRDGDQQQVLQAALWILNEQSDWSWRLCREPAHPSWVAFVAGGPHDLLAPRCDVHLLRSPQPLGQAEAVEVLSRAGHHYLLSLQHVWLEDTSGKSYQVVVPTAETLATTKFQRLYSMRSTHEREWSPTDVFDLQRLLALPGFQMEGIQPRSVRT
jgi:hypothetical protein